MRSRRSVRLAALAFAAGAFASACGAASDDAAAPATAPATVATAAETTIEPDVAEVASTDAQPAGNAPEILQFTNALVGGGELDAATLANKPTAFWFWSPT